MTSMREYNLDVFPQTNNLSYYLLGAFITDGSITNNKKCIVLEFSSSDESWIKNIAAFISKDIKVNTKITHINTKHYRFSVSEKTIINWLISNQCVNNKSLTVKFPNVPEEHLSSFLRGCMDGDGCISFKTKKSSLNGRKGIVTYLCGSSYEFLKQIQEKLKLKGIRANLRDQNLPNQMKVLGKVCNTNPHYRLTMTGRQAILFLDFIYSNNELCLDRKEKIYKEAKEYFSSNPITNLYDKK